jgi:SAM-dependent methyltransferase
VRNTEQQEYWDALAPEWIAAQHDLETVGGWFGDRALEALAAVPGEYVVDIGCGTGETTVALARAVGAEGRAVGVDISTGMIDEARRRAGVTTGLNLSFVVADAEDEPVANSADALFSRFGLMFFADPGRAFANLCVSLRPGGRLVAVVWQQLLANEWMLLPGMAALTVTGALPPMPRDGEPGPFSLAEPDTVRELLDMGGFGDIAVTPLHRELVVQRDQVEDYVRRSLAVGAAREAIRANADEPTLAAALGDQIRQDILGRMGSHSSTSLASAAWLVTAIRP